ncbi:MAG: bifunctional phosphoribosyl-AMP cyclohydrolase/phosphoribosyl-ATP diphosphatase HisIE [Planctomycetes bacterium]|nr:bifunctional phosphoribosyl-AMP cyclohydrolase/phosphoribosyl-ATP diphosphatase HisIE [Planctomycetota bacterium]
MTTPPFDPAPEVALAPEALAWDERGLVPAVVQDARTGEVLTLAYMNRDSLARTLETGETWFWSRSRRALWHKGETSGHVQRVDGLAADCDGDALVVRVTPTGPACHTGARTCFHSPVAGAPDRGRAGESLGQALDALLGTIAGRKASMPEGSYTTYLFRAGLNKVLKKVGEEATEVVVAAKEPDDDALAGEVADLLYHLGVLLHARGLDPAQVAARLAARRKPEGG